MLIRIIRNLSELARYRVAEKRYEALLDPDKPTLRLMNEYYVKEPTWCIEEDLNCTYPEGLSEDLKSRITKWAIDFHENCDSDLEEFWFPGFDTDAHYEQGRMLAQEVANEVGSRYQVVYWPWESRHPKELFKPRPEYNQS